MTALAPELTTLTRLASEFSPLWLRIDPATGLPAELGSAASDRTVVIDASAMLRLGGVDQRGALGDLVYPGAVEETEIAVIGEVTERLVRDGREFRVSVALGGWHGEIAYTFRSTEPSLTWSWRWRSGTSAEPIRDFVITLHLQLGAQTSWRVNAPGNRLRPDLPVTELAPATAIMTMGDTGGSAGIIGLSADDSTCSMIVWPRSKQEIGRTMLKGADGGVRIVYSSGLAAAASASTELDVDGIALDLVADDWAAVQRRVHRWYEDLGIVTPSDRAEWTRRATIYEVQIGTSIFAGGSWTYSPYPEMADLLADLPRIASLGFDTIQLMPRQPFPSYNVIDFDDIDTTFGNEADLVTVVEWCHANGMKVILDVLMHGVIDKESITEVADAVRSGPWAELARADAAEVEARGLTILEQIHLSWSRHILDFEESWRDGSPARHPLSETRPEWFCTDSRGRIIGVYTKAFDGSNPEWQQYFGDAIVSLVERLDVDGFRFDAPNYNNFPNWSPRTRTHASLQRLGAIGLFRDLRRRLHDLDPELMLYTEPNGPLWRQSMDVNYNYDESWLPDSLFGRGGDHPPSRVRSGRELAAWLADRDRSMPTGSVTAHHIDSHDTFWWPLPGSKWRREQFGIEATRALMTAFALSGGPYMMFVGGEAGMEDAIARVNAIRATRPELWEGRREYGDPVTDGDELYVLSHRTGQERSILMVNLSPRAVSVQTSLAGGDRWTDLLAEGGSALLADASRLEFAPFQSRFLVLA